jgi:S1-C subfamily serine protease
MSVVDLALVLLLALSVIGGYRRGALLQVCGLIGLAAGVGVGILLSPRVAETVGGRILPLSFALGTIVICASAGNLVGGLVGNHLRRKRSQGDGPGVLDRADAFGGVGISVAALLLATWFMGVNLAKGPFPTVARALRSSTIIEKLGTTLPQPPRLIPNLERVADAIGLPGAFDGLPPIPTDPVTPPDDRDVATAAESALPSVVEILGDGCNEGELNQGAGFAVADGYVVTNAHVVAGTEHQWVNDGQRHDAMVVEFDAALDVAVLYVPGWHAPALDLATDEVPRGTGGAVLGMHDRLPATVEPAVVRGAIEATGRDTFGRDEVTRRLYELQAPIRAGDSGSPFVLPDGTVAGVVFAASVLDDQVGYAIVGAQVSDVVDDGVGDTSPVLSLGECVI